MQLTVYGVPMYSLTGTSPTVPPAASAVQQTTIDPLTGLDSASIGTTVTFASKAGADGTSYYAINQATLTNGSASTVAEGGLEASDGNPLQPKFTADVTAPAGSGLIARGAVIESLISSEVNLDDPTIARAVVDNTVTETPPDTGVLIFPTAFATVHTEQTPNGPRGKLVVVPAQYNSSDDNEQLLIDSFDVRTYYAPSDTRDVVRPQFKDVSASGVPGALPNTTDLLLRASVTDPGTPDGSGGNVFSTGVKRVLIQYFDGRNWIPVEMFPANAARTEWSGGLPGVGAGGVFFVQAVDGAGNVSATANKGQNYVSGGQAAEAVAFVTGPEGDNGWFLGTANVELKGASVGVNTHTVQINGAAPVTYTAPIPLDTQGSNTVVITGPGATPIQLVVPVDTQKPIVDLETPIAVLSVDDTFGSPVVKTCTDPEPGSGLRDLDLATASNCAVTTTDYNLTVTDPSGGPAQVIGPFELATVRGQDFAGNEDTESQSAVILSGVEGTSGSGYYTTPVILGVLGDAALDATIKVGNAPAVAYETPIKIAATADVVVTIGDDEFRFPVNVDKTKPTASAVVPSDPLQIGDVVTVPCAFGDEIGGSGLDSVTCGSTVGTNETALSLTLDTSALVVDKEILVSATDKAGNSTTVRYTYSVTDQQAPTVSFDPLPAGPYFIGEVVPVTCRFADAGGSGLAAVRCGSENRTGATEISTSFVVASLGPDQEFTASATDGAGTETIASVKYTATDQAKPTATVDPIPAGPYRVGETVPVTCTFSDTGGSGLTSVTCGGTTSPATGNLQTVTVNVDTSTLGVDQVFNASATDAAGNDIIETFNYSVTDQAKPTVSAELPPGPYTKDQVVPVTCTFTDTGGSGLKSVTCGGAPITVSGSPSSFTVTRNVNTSTLDSDQQFTVSATDGANNNTTETRDYSVTDQAKPTATAVLPAGPFTKDQVVPVTCTFTDTGGSGLKSVTCGGETDLVTGDEASLTVYLDTSTAGADLTFVVSATDNAGNVSSAQSYTYTVVDPLCDPQGDAAQAKGDIIRCAAKVNADGTATISITVAGTISNDGTQYRLQLATSPNASGTQVKWSAGKITGTPLKSAGIRPGDPKTLDFVIDLAKVGCARGTTLYWRAEVQNGTKDPGVGFLDRAPNSGYFTLPT